MRRCTRVTNSCVLLEGQHILFYSSDIFSFGRYVLIRFQKFCEKTLLCSGPVFEVLLTILLSLSFHFGSLPRNSLYGEVPWLDGGAVFRHVFSCRAGNSLSFLLPSLSRCTLACSLIGFAASFSPFCYTFLQGSRLLFCRDFDFLHIPVL